MRLAGAMRNTVQREAIKKVFLVQNRPLRAIEVLEYGRQTVDSLNLATVYRNLNRLVGERWLYKVTHPELGTVFEREEKGHRHHFHCRKCNHLFDLPGCFLDEARHTPAGFTVDGHDLYLFGLCADCAGTNKQGRHQ